MKPFYLNLVIIVLLLFSCNTSNYMTTNLISQNYNEIHSNTDIDVLDIEYLSDTLKISGFIVKPNTASKAHPLPLLIYNRGGNRDYGAIENMQLKYIKELAAHGYIIMASQYRGNRFSEGTDEFGGNELQDIENLITIAENIDYIDHQNIGALGYSRGGMMTYLLSQSTDKIKVIATVGAVTNLFSLAKQRPLLYQNELKELIGDSINNRQEFIKRSSLYWAKDINEPLLLLHGVLDKHVHVSQAQNFSDSLAKYNKTFKHVFFEGGNHSLANKRKRKDQLILNWFDKHLKSKY